MGGQRGRQKATDSPLDPPLVAHPGRCSTHPRILIQIKQNDLQRHPGNDPLEAPNCLCALRLDPCTS